MIGPNNVLVLLWPSVRCDIDEDDESVEHRRTICQLRNFITMETKLKAQIIAAIDSEFLAAIEDPESWIWTRHQQTDATTPNQQIQNHHGEHQGTQCPMEGKYK